MNTCAMDGCNCEVKSGKQFCSEECARGQHAADGKCDCHHPECKGSH